LFDTGGWILGLEYESVTEMTSRIALICGAARAQATIPTETEISRFGCRESGPDGSDPEVWVSDWVWTDGLDETGGADVVM
jgi:hypothetical protein